MYCTEADAKLAGNYWQDLGQDAATRAENAIKQAQRFVDQQTGTFFDQRQLVVITEPISSMQKKLFMPAPVIELTVVTEGGVDILSSVLSYGKWLEKDAQSAGIVFPGDANTGFYWLNRQQAVRVEGTFGYAATPDDIVAATAFITAALLGWVEKSYVDANGISAAFRDNVFPPWVQQVLDDRKADGYDCQPMLVTTL